MKLYKKIVAVIMTTAMLISLCPMVLAVSNAGYRLEGTYNSRNNTLDVDVYIHDIDAVVGRLALEFDTTKLELTNSSNLSSAIRKANTITLTTEGLETSQLISQSEGYIMFAWYASNSHIDATSREIKIATISFNVKTDGTDLFDWNTLGLRHVDSTMLDKWKCGAYMRAQDYTNYLNTATDEDYICNFDITYPNSDREPDTAYNVNILLLDSTTGKPITADLIVANKPLTVSADGTVSLKLINGTYAYRATKSRYGTKQGTFTVANGDVSLTIIMDDYNAIVQNAKKQLEIGYASTDSASSVTQSLYLPTEGSGETTISWLSSDPEVISNTGLVMRQSQTRVVVLTASISKGDVVDTKDFEVTALSKQTAQEANEEAVNKDLSELYIGYAPGDSAESVTSDVALKTVGQYGSTILWESDNPDVVSSIGEVVRGSQDVKVILTATVAVSNVSKTKTFELSVKAKGDTLSDQEAVDLVYNAIQIEYAMGDSAIGVSQKIGLPTAGANDVTITWSSSDPNVITTYGAVIRQTKNTNIVLTAEITKGSVTRKKQYTVTVLAKDQEALTDTQAVQNNLNSLQIRYSGNDTAQAVTSDLTLPISGSDGVTIKWSSNNESVISSTGKVTRPAAGTKVVLTATVSRGDITITKDFEVNVLALGAAAPTTTPTPDSDASTGGGGGGGGGTPQLKPVPTATPDPQSGVTPTKAPDAVEAPNFTDLGPVPWAADSINRLAGLGIINGTSNTTFSPTSNIIRGDFITLLVRMLGLEGEITDTFDDVPKDVYYYNTISLAKSLGIVDGIGSNKFNPTGLITRQDMIVMTTRALNRLGIAEDKYTADLSDYADKDKIADYAVSSVAEMVAYRLITGNDKNELCPRNNTTRAEAAVFLDRIYVQSR